MVKAPHWSPLIEGLLEAVWVVDPLGLRILAVNKAAAALQQLTCEDMAGLPVVDLTASPEDLYFWEEVAAGKTEAIHSDTLLRRSDGSTVLVERRVSQVSLEDGSVVYLVGMQDKTVQQRTQRQLETLLAELRATLESTTDGILVCDLDGGIRACNRLFARMWGLPDSLLTERNDDTVHAHLATCVVDAEQYQQQMALLQRNPMMEAADVLVLRSGRVFERVTLPQMSRNRPIGRVYSYRDITERLATETQLKLAAKVFESSLDAIFVTDAQHAILTCNPAAAQLTQHTEAALVGTSARDLFFSRSLPDLLADVDRRLALHSHWEGEVFHRLADGSSVALLLCWVMLRDADGKPLHTVLFAKDLTEKLQAQQRIEQLAYTDPLTGLPNRLMLTERVNYALQVSERTGKGFAVLFLDLDRFKHINDSLGHLFGDRVLIEVSQRLKGCLRQTDTLCRLGGDEFVIHLHEADVRAAEMTAQRIMEMIGDPVELDDMAFSLSCSMGIALYPTDGRTLDELIQHADTAMYRVKERGKAAFRFYQPQMNVDLLSRIKMDHAMREGLRDGRFMLHYQPRVCLQSGSIHSCEALLRWNDPKLGLVPPGTFIGVAEETGFIVVLGSWVLQAAVQQATQWHMAGQGCVVSVNVSGLQFQQAGFVDEVAACLQQHGLPPQLLELELTETILLHDAEETLERLQRLASLGVLISLDDFGTGYSSLAYLRRFPLDTLKIDRSFIISAHEREDDAAIVAAIIQMGHALSLQVVAEGVEFSEQQSLLKKLGCDQYQGFLFSRAVDAEAFTALRLQQSQPGPPEQPA
jgi:diguanylate cyclase (GGDEF)-like protein/PAS domain S-box-containing protein